MLRGDSLSPDKKLKHGSIIIGCSSIHDCASNKHNATSFITLPNFTLHLINMHSIFHPPSQPKVTLK